MPLLPGGHPTGQDWQASHHDYTYLKVLDGRWNYFRLPAFGEVDDVDDERVAPMIPPDMKQWLPTETRRWLNWKRVSQAD